VQLLLAALLQALRLEREVSIRQASHHLGDHHPDRPALVDALLDQRAIGRLGHDLVRRERRAARRSIAPGPRDAGVDFGDLPHHLRQAWLLDLEALADFDAWSVERHDARDRRCP
jgi:hypothetical protein